MPYSLKTKEYLLEIYRDHLTAIQSEIDGLDDKRFALEVAKKQFSEKIAELTNGELTMPTREQIKAAVKMSLDYRIEMTWIRKIEFALRKLGKPSTTAEIVDYLITQESELGNPRSKSIGSVSAILSINKNNKFTKSKNENDENVYDIAK